MKNNYIILITVLWFSKFFFAIRIKIRIKREH